MLVHELVHHGMPNLADEHHWMEEGLATYVEPIARAQAGELERADGMGGPGGRAAERSAAGG